MGWLTEGSKTTKKKKRKKNKNHIFNFYQIETKEMAKSNYMFYVYHELHLK